jgi:prophage DNA circulation protein
MILLSIPEEAALCRAAFAGVKVGAMVRHCHHEQLAEPLTETPKARIAYILSFKPIEEQALRLRLFRPTYNAAVEAAGATYNAAVEAAGATYNAVLKAAGATYNAAVEAARATYATAIDVAQTTYNAAVKAAQATRATAVDVAQTTYNAAVDVAHQAECPDCPWDGRTIFP